MVRTLKNFIILISLLLGMSPLLIQCEDSKQKPKSEDDEDASPPENIAGTYLTCEYVSDDTAQDTEVGCAFANPKNQKKVELSSIVSKAEWQYSNDTDTDVTISVRETPADSKYHAMYTFQGVSQQKTRSAAQKTYIKVPIITKQQEATQAGSPMRDTFEPLYMTGDFDADGSIDLLDRNIDGSASLHLYNSKGSASFPFTTEADSGMNWNFSHYIAADLVSDPTQKTLIVARNLEGGIFKLYEHESPTKNYVNFKDGETWADAGAFGQVNSKSFFLDFSHYVVGSFNKVQETILMRKTDGKLEHRFIMSEAQDEGGVYIDGTWNYESYIAGDFNGDEYDDLLTVDLEGEGHVFINTTTAREKTKITFAAPVLLPNIGLQTCTAFVAADFLASGIEQVICRKSDGTLDMLEPKLTNGTLTWSLRKAIGTGWNALSYFAMKQDDKWVFVGRTKAEAIEILTIK
jgi:hypothetical protein